MLPHATAQPLLHAVSRHQHIRAHHCHSHLLSSSHTRPCPPRLFTPVISLRTPHRVLLFLPHICYSLQPLFVCYLEHLECSHQNRTSRAGKLRSTPSGPDDWHRVAGKIALAPLLSSFLSHPGTETEKMKPGRARASLLACLCAAIGTAWGALAAPRAAVRQQTPPRAFRCERARRAVTCVVWAVGGRGSGALATWSNLECSR